MLRSNLCDYKDAYIFVKLIIMGLNTAGACAAVNNTNNKLTSFKYKNIMKIKKINLNLMVFVQEIVYLK